MPDDAAAQYRLVLSGVCPFDETALSLSAIREWNEECRTCGNRYLARDGQLIVSAPIPGKVGRDVRITEIANA